MFLAFNVMAPFVIQEVLGYGPIFYGYMAFLMGLAFMAGAVSNTWLVHRMAPLAVIAVAVRLQVLAAVLMPGLHLCLAPALWLVLGPSLVIVFGAGLQYPNLAVRIFQPFPGWAGLVSSCYGLGSYLLSALLTAAIARLAVITPVMHAMVYLTLALLSVGVAAKMTWRSSRGLSASMATE